VGRRANVDPVVKVYESPYACFGNNPIAFADPLGLDKEDPKNPKTLQEVVVVGVRHKGASKSSSSQETAKSTIYNIRTFAGYHFATNNNFSFKFWSSQPSCQIQGTYACGGNNNYFSDTRLDNASRFNMFVSTSTNFNVDESEASKYGDYESMVVYQLLNGFVEGKGPENYNFPTNGIISSKFLNSDILKAAVTKFNNGNKVQNEQFSFGFGELVKDTRRNRTLYNITGLTGSGTITIVPTAKGVQIKIFNVTSLTSGDLLKNPISDKNWPKSIIRNSDKPTPYGNISQTYNLFIPYTKQ
jgi:hypothetical protein